MIICVKDQQSGASSVVASGERDQYDFPRWSGVHRVELLVAELRQQGFNAFVIACVRRLSYLDMCIQIESPRRSEFGSFSVCVEDDMAQKWMFFDARLEHLVERERAMLETQYRTVSVCRIDCSDDQSALMADVLSGDASTLVWAYRSSVVERGTLEVGALLARRRLSSKTWLGLSASDMVFMSQLWSHDPLNVTKVGQHDPIHNHCCLVLPSLSEMRSTPLGKREGASRMTRASSEFRHAAEQQERFSYLMHHLQDSQATLPILLAKGTRYLLKSRAAHVFGSWHE